MNENEAIYGLWYSGVYDNVQYLCDLKTQEPKYRRSLRTQHRQLFGSDESITYKGWTDWVEVTDVDNTLKHYIRNLTFKDILTGAYSV